MEIIRHPRFESARTDVELRREARRDPELRAEGERFLPSPITAIGAIVAMLVLAGGVFYALVDIGDQITTPLLEEQAQNP